MQLRDDTYRAVELLRFLRGSTAAEPWTAKQLAVILTVDDHEIAKVLAPLYHLDREREDLGAIRRAVVGILGSREQSGQGVACQTAVDNVLDVLKRNHWVDARRGRGYWLTDVGASVTLLEVLNAFGDEPGVSRCSRAIDRFACPYMNSCRGQQFHRRLSEVLAQILGKISIADIASGTWAFDVSVKVGKQRRLGSRRGKSPTRDQKQSGKAN